MIYKIRRALKQYGFFGGIKYLFNKATGRYKMQESIDTMYYFLNKLVNISDFPKAQGDLRKLQKCDVELLHIFDLVCKKHNLTYWLDYGTLLGAIRHSGFIPWDDDLDVTMPREDYDKALEILPKEMSDLGIDVGEFSFKPLASFGFSYKHKETGIWLDVFPVDECYYENDFINPQDDLRTKVLKYRKYYKKYRNKKNKSDFINKKQELILQPQSKSNERNKRILFNAAEFLDPVLTIHNGEDIYPLGKSEFEEYSFSVPKNIDSYLSKKYGSHYMEFPKGGIEHHGSEDAKLKNWAKINNVNMDDILEELKEIKKKIVG